MKRLSYFRQKVLDYFSEFPVTISITTFFKFYRKFGIWLSSYHFVCSWNSCRSLWCSIVRIFKTNLNFFCSWISRTAVWWINVHSGWELKLNWNVQVNSSGVYIAKNLTSSAKNTAWNYHVYKTKCKVNLLKTQRKSCKIHSICSSEKSNKQWNMNAMSKTASWRMIEIVVK